MISADFYPTERTFTNGQITKYFPRYNQSGSNYLEIIESEVPDMYYLGWIKWENTPSTFLMSESKNTTVNGTDYNTMTMTTTPANFNIGYLGNFENTYTPAYQNAFNTSYVDTMWKQSIGTDSNASANRGFVNRFAVSAINYSYVTIAYAACLPNVNNTARYYATQNINAEDFEDWKESTQTLTFNNLGEVTVDNSVLNEQFYQDVDVNGTTYRIFIFSYAPYQDRPMNSNNDTDAYTWITPFLNVNGSGTGPGVPSSGTELQILTSAQSAMFYNYDSNYGGFDINWGSGYSKNTYRYFSNGGMGCSQVLHDENWTYEIYPSGFRGKIDYNWASSYSTIGFYFDDDTESNIYLYKDRNDFSCLGRMFTPIDIIHHMSLLPRWKAKSSDPATFGVQDGIYYPEVLPTNEFTGRLITGTRAELLEVLRPWQIDADYWDSNDYTPEDLPPYEPEPEPSPINPPDEGDWGSKIPYTIFQMGESPFSHFEQLTYNGLEEFMAKLWHAPQTFWESLSATKEITANLNDYLISCRAYPIFVNGAVEHHDIYLGVGGKITLANSIYTPTIVNLCACGSITVGRPYGNFLDYNPYTSASIYLPFAGQFEINPKYIYDTQLSLMLWVDLTDGSGVWVLRNTAHEYPILIKQCKVAIDIPISGQDAAQKSSNIINATLNTAQHTLTSVNRITGMANQIGLAVASGGIPASGAINLGTEAAGLALTGLSDSVNMAMANKELPYYTTGSAGAAAAEACSEPYITLRTPLCDNPTNFAHTIGNLYNKTAAISTLSGFTTCRNVDVSGISQATEKEKAQIKQILESGFYS